MKVSSIPFNRVAFRANQPQNDPPNPISKAGERAVLLKATAGAGLVVGAKLLYEIFINGDFLFEDFFKTGKKLASNGGKTPKNPVLYLGAGIALMAGFVGAVSVIYTALNTPKIMYQGKVNAFAKGKDMDVYAKMNTVEKELYNQMLEKSKNATPEEKEILKRQYLKLTAAKNQVPDSVKPKTLKA